MLTESDMAWREISMPRLFSRSFSIVFDNTELFRILVVNISREFIEIR